MKDQTISNKILNYSVKLVAFENGKFVLKNTFKQFPKNTIHIIGVDAEKNEENNLQYQPIR